MKAETFVFQPVIEADRFILRPLQKSDAPILAEHAADSRIAMGTKSIPHPLPSGATEALVARARDEVRETDTWVLDGTKSGRAELLGSISLTRIGRGQSEVAFWVVPGSWNDGLASEAVRALLAANPHQATAIFAEVFQDNAGSARVLANNGFTYLGEAEAFSEARAAKVATWTYMRCMKDQPKG